MDAQEKTPRRSHPAHGVLEFPDKPTIVFVTICTEKRVPWLATEFIMPFSETFASEPQHGTYVLMPDHLHLFAAPGEIDLSLDSWIRYVKSQFRKEHPDKSLRWQTDRWDTRLRNGESYDEKWQYVWNNPVRAGLAECAEAWPFQGELLSLRWE